MAAGQTYSVNFLHVGPSGEVTEPFSYLIFGGEWPMKPGMGIAVVAMLAGDGPDLPQTIFLADAGIEAAVGQARDALKARHKGLKAVGTCPGL